MEVQRKASEITPKHTGGISGMAFISIRKQGCEGVLKGFLGVDFILDSLGS